MMTSSKAREWYHVNLILVFWVWKNLDRESGPCIHSMKILSMNQNQVKNFNGDEFRRSRSCSSYIMNRLA